MDLENVTLKNGRRIQGAHVYATVAGSGQLQLLDSDDHARSAIQRLALWQAEVAKIAKAFDVPIIAFQGGRVHLLAYRPIDDNETIARKAVLLGRAITYMTRDAFNPLFDSEQHLQARAAADLGETVATRGGVNGDSELLFLGNAANRPAKLLVTNAVLTVTTRLSDALGELDYETTPSSEADAVIVRMSREAVELAVEEDDVDWSVERSAGRLETELETWPIDGYSDYIEAAENDEVKRDAILSLDAIRQELRSVLKSDFKGVRVQYQGDNMIGFAHLPADNEEKIAEVAAEIAAAMQASMSITLPQIVAHVKDLDVSVGVSMKRTVVACLGEYAKRNGLVVGPAPTEAERIQTRLPGKQTGIDKSTYDALPPDIQELYEWSPNAKAYVAEDLSASKLARVREALSQQRERTIAAGDRSGRLKIGPAGAAAATNEAGEHVRPFRPYAE
jgi:class 3 adenylate cyclase